MQPPANIGGLSVSELVGAVGSDQVTPGAGVAGAVALALAAACAAKAVSISLKHRSGDLELARSRDVLGRIEAFALAGADRDAQTFGAFIKEHSSDAAEDLIEEGQEMARLTGLLSRVVAKIAVRIETNMSGDINAARALIDAAQKIQTANSAEAQADARKSS